MSQQPSSLGGMSGRPPFASRPDLGSVGSILDGRYRVEHVIGEGGMGVVVKATDLRLQRTVAIKLLHSEYADQEDVLERFAREAMVIAKLRSRHVVSVLDVSTDPKSPYLVLEFLEGESLEDRIFRDGPLPLAEAVKYTRQIAEALEEAHGVGILHRDIKPANVFLTRQTNHEIVAQILDFGTARFYDAKRDGQMSKPTITKQYETFGSPAYMPPEQISSARNTDERSDIWALGTVLYEALTGQLAFEGEYPEVFVVISTREPPPVRSLRPDAPPELETIIERCLRKVKEDRYASMTELKRALQSLEQEILPARARPNHTVPSPPMSGPASVVSPTTPAPPPKNVLAPTPAMPFPVFVDALAAAPSSAPPPAMASNQITQRGIGHVPVSRPIFDDQETYLEPPLESPSRKLLWFGLIGALLVLALLLAVFWMRASDGPNATVVPHPSARLAGDIPPPEPVKVESPAPSAVVETPPLASTVAVLPAPPPKSDPKAGTKPAAAGGKPGAPPKPSAPPVASATKPPPALPGEAPIPSGDDIGRRK